MKSPKNVTSKNMKSPKKPLKSQKKVIYQKKKKLNLTKN